MMCIVAPSILSADFSNMGDAVRQIETSGADWVHVDVMDGRFVPAITFGPKMVGDLRAFTKLPFDVHLMIVEPEKHIAAFAAAGADCITFHAEAVTHQHRLAQQIRDMGKKCGISIVPSTSVSCIDCMLQFVDLVLVMTVNPGAGGQKIIEACFEKTATLVRLREERGLSFLISVDGGVNEETAAAACRAGADVLIAGSAFFNAKDKRAFVHTLKGASKDTPIDEGRARLPRMSYEARP
ncbi:MAG: ribulose-phosphate 3-epimerase [Spirochaetaceae bacterium]|jgi:ribulose-phosphate 3-epimerase|nr:ribulose-phosphate 3-epimerase [Spirochaetaceae bacterium]